MLNAFALLTKMLEKKASIMYKSLTWEPYLGKVKRVTENSLIFVWV